MNQFKYIPFPNSYPIPPNSLILVEKASLQIAGLLRQADISSWNLSDYNKRYLQSYINSIDFYLSQYAQLMLKVLALSSKPIHQSTFIDYGGGCGILSLLASRMGFKQIIYNDIYDVSAHDAMVIAGNLGILIDHYVEGDINDLCLFVKQNNLGVDFVCSFDVLEHLHHWENWFKQAQDLQGKPSFVFLTSANGSNPFIRHRLMKLQKKAELQGRNKSWGWKDRDASESFLSIRKKIILNEARNLTSEEVALLAKRTRGLIRSEIIEVVNQYKQSKTVGYHLAHPSNTCDPYTGNWTEHIINTKELVNTLNQMGYKTSVSNGFYSQSNNKLKSLPKMFLNQLIRFSGKTNLFFSPTYTLTVKQ